jgi:hypothetical protein
VHKLFENERSISRDVFIATMKALGMAICDVPRGESSLDPKIPTHHSYGMLCVVCFVKSFSLRN